MVGLESQLSPLSASPSNPPPFLFFLYDSPLPSQPLVFPLFRGFSACILFRRPRYFSRTSLATGRHEVLPPDELELALAVGALPGLGRRREVQHGDGLAGLPVARLRRVREPVQRALGVVAEGQARASLNQSGLSQMGLRRAAPQEVPETPQKSDAVPPNECGKKT